MKKGQKIITYIVIFITFAAIFFLGSYSSGCSSTQVTSLDRCLQMGKGGSWFGDDPVKDSIFIRECRPFHRELLVDKYLFKAKLDKDGNIIGREQIKDGKAKKFTKSEILLFIESGHFQRR